MPNITIRGKKVLLEVYTVDIRLFMILFFSFIKKKPLIFSRIDPAKLLFNVKTFTPLYSFTALYNIRLKLGLIDIQGEGDMKGDLSEFNPLDRHFSVFFLLLFVNSFASFSSINCIFITFLVGLNIHLRIQLANQGNSVKIQKVQNRVRIDKGRFNFNNLFNGDKVLSQVRLSP